MILPRMVLAHHYIRIPRGIEPGIILVKFIHTADWHLGMRRSYMDVESQARYSQDSFEAIRKIGVIAKEEGAQFVVVCGDVFDTNFVDRKTVARALEAMSAAQVPFYILPGNHDPMDPSSVYLGHPFQENKPSNVNVISDSHPISLGPDVVLIGAPWMSKRPLSDILNEACASLEAVPGVTHIVLGHGGVSVLPLNRDDPAMVNIPALETLIQQGAVHYVAMGDRHSIMNLGSSGRIWYSGSHLATDFGEECPGHVLLIDIDNGCKVEKKKLTNWQFIKKDFALNEDADLAMVDSFFQSLEEKERAAVRLSLRGAISLRGKTDLDEMMARYSDLFAYIECSEVDMTVAMDPEQLRDGLGGYAQAAVDQLIEMSQTKGEEAGKARDALLLLLRLKRRCPQ